MKIYCYMLGDSLVTIYRVFRRPHLDYADVRFDKPSNATFTNQLKSAQCNSGKAQFLCLYKFIYISYFFKFSTVYRCVCYDK